MKFDVVIGNPPYNAGKGTRSSIWQHFVVLATECVTEAGLVSLIHPSGWRHPQPTTVSSAKTALRRGQMHWLSIHSKPEGIQTFGAGTRYDWYVWQNVAHTQATQVRFEGSDVLEEFRIPGDCMVPNFVGKLWTALMQAASNVGRLRLRPCNGNHAQKTFVSYEGPTPERPLPVVRSIAGHEVRVMWSSQEQQHHDEVKVVIADGDYPYPIMCPAGVGSGNHIAVQTVKTESDARTIITFLRSKVGWAANRSTKWSNIQTEYKMLQQLPDPTALGLTGDSTDEEIYAALGLDEETIQEIEELAESGTPPRPEAVAVNTQEQLLHDLLAEHATTE